LKKTVNPAVAGVIIAVIVLIAGVLFFKGQSTGASTNSQTTQVTTDSATGRKNMPKIAGAGGSNGSEQGGN